MNYQKVDPKHPFIGLNNQVCRNPKHYCCYHDVWMSDADVQKRGCKTRNEGDQCLSLKENHYERGIEALLRKTRPTRSKQSKRYYGEFSAKNSI